MVMDHDVVRRLFDAVNARDEAGVAQALALGADPDATDDRFSGSALSRAAGLGQVRIVELLLDADAAAGSTNPRTRSPLRAAVQQAHPEVAELLITRGALQAEPATWDSGVRWDSLLADAVAFAGSIPRPAALQTLRLLLRLGAGPAPGEQAPLIRAVQERAAPAVLRILLEHGADPNQHRGDATPALVLAARRGDHAAVDVLLAAGADINAADARGRTALMHAIERDERTVVAVLCLAGADIDQVSIDGATAVQLARGWQRQFTQFMLGERHVGLDDVAIVRTAMRCSPIGYQLRGDPGMFRLLAQVIEHSVNLLGPKVFDDLTSTRSEDALGLARRLRSQPVPAPGASWHTLDVTSDELRPARAALLELTYGTPMAIPDGISHHDIVDLYDELERQLRR
jgi:ankyrin repeat protein